MTETNVQESTALPAIPQKKKKHIFLKTLLTLLILILIIASFLFGILIGGQYGVKIKGITPDKFPIMEYVADALQEIGTINSSVNISEDMLNELLVQNESNFAPLKNIYASTNDGYIVFSGQITAESINESAFIEIPEILWLFLPSVLNLKADVQLTVENNEPKIDITALSILNAENDQELISLSGFDELFQELIEDVIKESLPQTVTFREITVTENGINIKGTFSIVAGNE